MKFINTSWVISQGQVKTSSRFRKWWLTRFRGYTVAETIIHPNRMIMGKLLYTKTWVLKGGRKK